MLLLSLRTCVHIWKSPELDALDSLLKFKNIDLLDLNWERFKLISDQQHFSNHGFIKFSTELAKVVSEYLTVKNLKNVVIMSDSTIGFMNVHNFEGDEHIIKSMAYKGIHAIVDSEGGSGYVSMSDSNNHFHARLSQILRRMYPSSPDAVLIIGGWNDIWNSENVSKIERAIDGIINLTRRWSVEEMNFQTRYVTRKKTDSSDQN